MPDRKPVNLGMILNQQVAQPALKWLYSRIGEYALTALAVDRVGQAIYEDEDGSKLWASMAPRERKIWVDRGRSAILGLRQYIFKK